MLRVQAAQVDTLWDPLLPAEVRALPHDLARLDHLLSAPELLRPFKTHWEHKHLRFGRPSIPMATYLRLMVIKQRMGWGYETLVREVADSFHLRRFCLLSLDQAVPDESTLRKLTRRLGPELVDELIRETVRLALRERRFRPRAMRCDSTVVAADIRYPTDIDLAAHATRKLAKLGRKLQDAVPGLQRRVRDRSRAVGKRVRALGQTLRRRSGDARAEVARLTQETAAHAEASVREARKLLAEVQDRSAGASKAVTRVVNDLQQVIQHAERVAEQIRQRFTGERITDRLVSLSDPDARPVRRGKLAQPTEFGYVVQLAEMTANTRRGARGLVLPPKLRPGSEHENNLLPQTVEELITLGLSPEEAVFDAGFAIRATAETMAKVGTEPFIVGSARARTRPRRTQRRLARYRVGSEGRISHLKRGYHLGRTRLRGQDGAQTWASWSVFTYDVDTVAAMI